MAEYAGRLEVRVAELEAELRAHPADDDRDRDNLIRELTRCLEEREARVVELLAERRNLDARHEEDTRLLVDLTAYAEGIKTRNDELSAERRNLDARHEEDTQLLEDSKRLIGELTQFAERLKAALEGMQAMVAPLAAALCIPANKKLDLPSVKAVLVNRFHPEKHPEADAETRAAYGEAMQVINDAYAWIKQIQDSDSSSPS